MMKTMQTVVLEDASQNAILEDTLNRMSSAQNFVVDVCYESEDTNTFRVHHKTYSKLRQDFGLPSQLAVVANKYACASVKTSIKRKGRKPVFSGKSIHYDARSCTINLEKRVVSLLTIKGRIKIKFEIPKYFKQFAGWKAKESNLVKCKDGKFRLMVSIERTSIKSKKTGRIIAVDRGINNLIATSDGWLYESKHIWEVKQGYASLRSRLQSKGTRSVKRHLAKMRGRERRFMRDVNHCISRKLIESAGKDGVIVLEKLNGVRDAKHRKAQNWLFSNWAFYQLGQFLIYKGEEIGVAIEFVPAKDTSKTCSICGSLRRGQRQGSVFRCKACGVVLHADLNAAKNILHKYHADGLLSTSLLLPKGLSKPSISMDDS
jgi:IS605 OrfB family transposase